MSSRRGRPTGVNGEILAAGGVIVRTGRSGPELAVVHRPHRDDWTFPKGHVETGELPVESALREVEEETGYRCIAMAPLGRVGYRHTTGRAKLVDYWLMTIVAGAFEPNDEVDELRWVPLGEVTAILSHTADHVLVERIEAVLEQ